MMVASSPPRPRLMDLSDPKPIYESPDGGKTVYVRMGGERIALEDLDQRWIDLQLAHHRDRQQIDRERKIWQQVLAARNHDPDIRDLLEQAKTIYLLRREDDDGT